MVDAAPSAATTSLTDPPRAERLARLRELAGDLRPVTLAAQRRLPVLPPIEGLLPDGGLQRGGTVAISGPGATTLTHALIAGPTRAGSWAAFLGGRNLGWCVAEELGVVLSRVAVVEADDRRRSTVLASLIDAFDLVVIGSPHRPTADEARRLQARARERGTVLLAYGRDETPASTRGRDRSGVAPGPWPGADMRLVCGPAEWTGPGAGWGHLEARRVTVTVDGRRSFDRPRRVDLWLPGPDGVTAVGDSITEDSLTGDSLTENGTDGLADVVSFSRRR